MKLRCAVVVLVVIELFFSLLIAMGNGQSTQLSISGDFWMQSGKAPVALFDYSPLGPVVNETVMFSASRSYDPDGFIVSYLWDFGDGNITMVNDPFTTHIYTVAHSTVNYTVTLTVTDNDGLTNSTSTTVPVTNPTILHVSVPAGEDRTGVSHPDPWLDECWLLNITGTSGTFTVRIEDVSWFISSYDTHLVIALNDAAYNNLVSLTVDNITIVKNDLKYGTLRPYNLGEWPSGDVYPTWFNDTLVNVGTIPPESHMNVTVSVTFSNATGARMHFDAYGSKMAPSQLFSDGFETGAFEAWNQVFGTASVVTDSNVYNGTYKAQFSANGDRARVDVGSAELVYARAFVCFDDLPSINGEAAQFSSIGRYGSGWAMRAFITHNGSDVVWRIGYKHGASVNYANSGMMINPSADAWHNVTIMVNYTSNTGYYKIWVNGTELADISSSGSRAFADIDFYLTGSQNIDYSTNVWMDDVKVETGPVKESYITENPLSEDSTVLFLPPLKHYLTVVSPYSITNGEGWYDNCTNAYAALDTGIVDHGNGTRRVFTHWSADASGTDHVSSDPIHMDQNKTAVANWKTQYYLTVFSAFDSPGGEGWYDSGATAYGTLVTGTVDHGNGTHRVFTSWGGDASGTNFAQSDPILMDEPKTATANWKTQHYLTLTTSPGGVTNPSSSGWHDTGTNVSVSAIPDTCYMFDHWELDSVDVGSANPYSVWMSEDHTLRAIFAYFPPPSVSMSPPSASIGIGDSVTFTSTVTGGMSPYTYQWFLDGNPVSGATSNNWIFTPTSTGVYYVYLKVTDACSSVAQSDAARVTASGAPIGGYSISLTEQTGKIQLVYYTMLVAIFTVAISLTRRKRKTYSQPTKLYVDLNPFR